MVHIVNRKVDKFYHGPVLLLSEPGILSDGEV